MNRITIALVIAVGAILSVGQYHRSKTQAPISADAKKKCCLPPTCPPNCP